MKINSVKFISLVSTVIFLAAAIDAEGQIAAGGAYTLDQAVVAGGGGASSDAVNNNYKVEGTSGQAAAGVFATGGGFAARSGFWAPNLLAPTAAGVTVGGRVNDLVGVGLRNVRVILTGGNLIVPRVTKTSAFGFFTFEDVAAGQTYTLSVEHKKYGFGQNSQVISVVDGLTDLVFQATWEN